MSLLSFAKKAAGAKDDAKKASSKKPAKDVATKSDAKKKDSGKEATVVTPRPAGAIYLEPLITEKSLLNEGVYAFRVRPEASKGQIMASVATRYNVTPKAVRTLVVRPKARRRGATTGTTSAWKKAYVTLPQGKTIDLTV